MTRWIPAYMMASVLISGCGISQSKYYTSFQADMADKAQVNIAVDTLLLRDIKGEIDGIDLQHNREMSEKVGLLVCEQLQSKGYRVNRSVLHSVGFLGGPRSRFIILETDGSNTSSEPSYTPYYYDQEHYPGPHNGTATHLFNHVYFQPLMRKGGDPVFDEITRLPLPANEATVLIMVMGRNVPAGKQIGQGILVGLASLGTMAVFEADYFYIKMVIVDNATGRVLWSDLRYSEMDPTEKSISLQLQSMLSRIPDYQDKQQSNGVRGRPPS